jgi:hypothetical protein
MELVQSLAGFLVETTAKATLLLLLACVTAWLLSRSSASVRHRLSSLTMLTLILLPVASMALPSWAIAVLPVVDDVEVAAPDDLAIEPSPIVPPIESPVSTQDNPAFDSSRQPIVDGSKNTTDGQVVALRSLRSSPESGHNWMRRQPRSDEAELLKRMRQLVKRRERVWIGIC